MVWSLASGVLRRLNYHLPDYDDTLVLMRVEFLGSNLELIAGKG